MVLSINKTFDSGRGSFLTHCMRKKIMEQKLTCGPQFQPTVSSVHFSLMTLSPKNDTRTCWKTVSSQVSWQQVSLYTQWFIQDGARPHTANVVLDFLYETFNLRVMSHRFPERHEGGKFWPPHSPDINPCNFFLWDFLKEKVFQSRPENLAQLRAHVVKLCSALSGLESKSCDECKGSFARGCEAKRWSY